MLKKMLVKMLKLTVTISFGTLIACAVWCTVTFLTDGVDLLSAKIPFVILWEILSVGVLCGVGTVFILGGALDDDNSKPVSKLRFVLHYCFISLVVLVCGYFYEWYRIGVPEIIMMCATITAVYAFVYLFSYISGSRTVKKMNERLKEYNRANENARSNADRA